MPNIVTMIRLAGVPLFLWLVLVRRADGWAVAVLALGGWTDWVDGFLARRLHQVSHLGALLDPIADRLYILATLLALSLRGVVPWWFTIALLAREGVLLVSFAVLRAYGYGPPPVHYVGKSATFILLFAFPALLLAHAVDSAAVWAYPLGWALAWWGLVLYWVAGLLYLMQSGQILNTRRSPAPPARTNASLDESVDRTPG